MFPAIVLCFLSLAVHGITGQIECTDLRGRQISHGLHYVPGPDTCTLCVCDNGLPKVCKAVLCSPPQDCRSFRVGNTCCEFICLDDVVKPSSTEGSEVNLRIAASGIAIVILFAVAILVYRVKKQKVQRGPHTDDQRSLTSIGYISGSMGHMGGTCETALASWKPPGHYLPRGEAPPPYDEAVAQSQQHRMEQFHRPYPNVDGQIQNQMHYANVPRPQQQMANSQPCYAAPLLQPMSSESQLPMPHPLAANLLGFHRAVRLTGSLGTISGRGLAPREMTFERPRHLPPYYTRSPVHRTIPRISTAVDTTILDAPTAFSRTDRSGVPCEVRRSFHKPAERMDTGRSMPRNLNFASVDTEIVARPTNATPPPRRPDHNHHQVAARSVSNELPRSEHQSMTQPSQRSHVIPKPAISETGLAPTLPITVDKPSCVCSYEESNAVGGEDADDYRNECENCKSASSSRWVLEEAWHDEEETQTLQRRAPQPSPAPATATLPQRQTKQTRPLMGPSSNWENWFGAIPDSDTESEE